MARKISQDQLRRDIFKPLAQHELLSKDQFEKAFPASEFERYSISGLNKARTAIFEKCKANPDKQNDIIEKANKDFNSLKRVNVMLSTPEGKNFETVFFVRAIEKGMKSEEINLEKDESKPGKKKNSKDPDNDGDDDSVNSKNNPDETEDNKSGGEEETEETNENESDEDENEDDEKDEDEDEVSDEAMDVLAFIKECLDGGDDAVDEKEISDEEGLSDDETNALIEELIKKGYIESEEDKDGRGYDITGITEEGLAAMDGGDDEDTDDDKSADVQGDKVVMDKKEFVDEHEKLVNKLNQVDKKEAGNQKEELDNVKEEDKQENAPGSDVDANADVDNEGEDQSGSGDQSEQQTDSEDQTNDNQEDDQQQEQGDSGHKPTDNEKQGAQAGQQGGMDANQLAQFAKQTPTDKLEEYVADQSNPPANIQVAQAELDRRKQEGDAGPSGNNNEEQSPEEKAEKDKFDGWLGDYLEDHDIEDLQELVRGLILASPSETKILKDHYRNDFQGQNKGNKALKVDKKEFEDWIIQYLEHYPQAHLKEYAMKLASKDPDALNKLKGKYKALKDNKIV